MNSFMHCSKGQGRELPAVMTGPFLQFSWGRQAQTPLFGPAPVTR